MKIEILYPELCNLYGDLANAEVLARAAGAELVKTSLKDTPRFLTEDIALVTMGGTTERGQELARDAFAPYLDALKKRTEEGGVTLITGNALEIFGKFIQEEDGTRIPMLGFFPLWFDRHLLSRYNALYLGKMDDMTIVGFKSQFGHAYGEAPGLFETLRGAGRNPDVTPEGVRIGNLMATYLLGPLVILNPPFAKYLLTLMGVEDPVLPFEDAAMEVYMTRVREFSEPNRGFVYH